MKANYTRQDTWEREIYTTPNGEEYAMIDGSLHNEPILYSLDGGTEPSYPIRIKGEYITADMIEGIKPEICINCNHHLGTREASKKRAEYSRHTGQEVPKDERFLCDNCTEVMNAWN